MLPWLTGVVWTRLWSRLGAGLGGTEQVGHDSGLLALTGSLCGCPVPPPPCGSETLCGPGACVSSWEEAWRAAGSRGLWFPSHHRICFICVCRRLGRCLGTPPSSCCHPGSSCLVQATRGGRFSLFTVLVLFPGAGAGTGASTEIPV